MIVEPKYDLHVQLQPKVIAGLMQHPWSITISYADGTFDIANGFASSVSKALNDSYREVISRGLVK